MHKIIASLSGIGYIKGGGTIAAAITCCAWWLLSNHFHTGNASLLIATLIVILMGIWSATIVDGTWGKDSSKVVVDEVAGMSVSMLFVPVTFKAILAAFILFRIFDITKPFYIKHSERLPKGWGVMADDILAGIYANLLLHVFIMFNPSIL